MIPGVRDVITKLNYAELEQADIIPFGVFDSVTVPKRKFPTIVYNTQDGFSKFGHFMEALLRSYIQQDARDVRDARLQYYADLLHDARYESIWSETRAWALQEFADRACVFDVELMGDRVAGHPDIIITITPDNWLIADVKTTSNFAGMRESTVLQLLSYAALARKCGITTNIISVVLPWQRMHIQHDIASWDHVNFLFMLEYASTPIVRPVSHPIIRQGVQTVGSHAHRLDTLYETFNTFYQRFASTAACQIFLSGNQAANKKKFDASDIQRTREYLLEHQIRTYIHAPYSINLSRSESWMIELLQYQLKTGAEYGARGVVVHVGKHMSVSANEGKSTMIESIRACLDTCSPQCQLLIETPAGQGTELYVGMHELWDFWCSFTPAEHSRMGICIDTCHVFAAGHDPVEYLQFWLQHDSTAIGLIHLNDSKYERGARKDRPSTRKTCGARPGSRAGSWQRR
jgi:deoxyribonuclease-4